MVAHTWEHQVRDLVTVGLDGDRDRCMTMVQQDVGATSARCRSDVGATSARCRRDDGATSARRRSDVAPTSLRRRTDVAPTSILHRSQIRRCRSTGQRWRIYACVTCCCVSILEECEALWGSPDRVATQ